MSTLRMVREVTILAAAASGAVIGYTAGGHEATTQIICSFAGMSVLGAFADFCIRGNK
jgi:hypothetical protein